MESKENKVYACFTLNLETEWSFLVDHRLKKIQNSIGKKSRLINFLTYNIRLVQFNF